MMNRTAWILLAIFVVLLAGALFIPKWLENAQPKPATPTSEIVTNLLNIASNDVKTLSVASQTITATAVTMTRSGAGWDVSGVQLDYTGVATATIESGVTQLASLRVISTPDATTDLGTLGLASPAYVITITLQSGVQHVLHVGDVTPSGKGYYVQLDTAAPLVVSKYGVDTLIGWLKSPPVMTPTPTPTITPTVEVTITPALSTTLTVTVAPTETPMPLLTETATPQP